MFWSVVVLSAIISSSQYKNVWLKNKNSNSPTQENTNGVPNELLEHIIYKKCYSLMSDLAVFFKAILIPSLDLFN